MSLDLKCAACGHEVPFKDGKMNTEAICPGCEVLVRRRSEDDEMAIPVSMALPDEFEPANLETVPKHSRELIHRYQKSNGERIVKTGDPLSDSNLILASAIQQLAEAIEGNNRGGLVPGATEEGAHSPATNGSNGANGSNGHSSSQNGIPVLNGNGSEKEPKHERALPVGSPVLVRREAAAEAHRFQRQHQAATDIKGPQQSGLAKWIEKHPVAMMLTGLALLITLVVLTTILMNDALSESQTPELAQTAMLGESNTAEPDFQYAEKEARGFLNAISLNPAQPYIFRASSIGPKLEKFFQPLPDPANYSIELKSRQKNGEKAVYYYQVTSGDLTQPLVVLQENQTFKVFWEYGACVGDISWEAFVDQEPSEPILMRAFLRPDPVRDSVHPEKDWTSWIAENWDGSRSARVFSKVGSPGDRRLKSALVEHPVTRKDSPWVMAQVRLKHVGTGIDRTLGAFESAEVVEVPLGSWLPEEFVVGNTFYSEEDRLEGPVKDNRGLQKRKDH